MCHSIVLPPRSRSPSCRLSSHHHRHQALIISLASSSSRIIVKTVKFECQSQERDLTIFLSINFPVSVI
jgi:hypothetical protein